MQTSRLFLGGSSSPASVADALPGLIDRPVGDPAAPEARARTATTARRAFIEGSARTPAESAERIRKPSSPNILQAGSLIPAALIRSEEHPSELQSLMRNSYAVFCLKKKKKKN